MPDPRALSKEPTPESARALRDQLGQDAWQLLGSLSLEGGLSEHVLHELATDASALAAFTRKATSRDLLCGGVAPYAPGRRSEPGLVVAPRWRQLVLRELRAGGELEAIVARCHRQIGVRSQAPLELALQLGDLASFRTLRSAQPVRQRGTARSEADWLRESICEPFDAAWFLDVWGHGALGVAEGVLRDALRRLSPVRGLEAWFEGQLVELPAGETKQRLLMLFAEHAVLRGDVAALRRRMELFPSDNQIAYELCAALVEGDRGSVTALCERFFQKRKGVPDLGSLAPILALLRAEAGTQDAFRLARRLVSKGRRPEHKAAAKAFNGLLSFLTNSENLQRRVDVYPLARSGSFWELLLFGTAVELHVDHEVTRAAWAAQLARAGLDWLAAGYAWIARQGFSLARRFDAEHAEKALGEQGWNWEVLEPEPLALSLWTGLRAKPEWEKALQRLSRVSGQLQQTTDLIYRVAWFVDMTDGELSRPALQEFRSDMGTWTQGRRMSWASLFEYRDQLPAEDVRALDCSRELYAGAREPTDDAIFALIGHPRVFNGARSMLPVSVLRGRARVETQELAGHIRVVVEPEGALPGVNVSVEAEDRLRVYRVSENMGRVIEALPHGVRIPKAKEAELLEVLGNLSLCVDVVSPELGVESEVEADATPVVRVALHSGAWLVQFGVRPFGKLGRFFVAGDGRHRIKLFQQGQRMRCQRDLQHERSTVDALIATCTSLPPVSDETRSPSDPPDSWVVGEEGLLSLVSDLRGTQVAHALEWPERTALRLRGTASSSNLHGQLRCIKGWYLAQGEVKLSEVDRLSLEQLAKAAPVGLGRFVRLPDGDYVEVEAKVRRVLACLRGASSAPRKSGAKLQPSAAETGLALHPGALAALRELADPTSGFELDEDTQRWLARVAELEGKDVELPPNLRAELRAYQRSGYQWLSRLAELGLGACLADDMGLGKTLQIISLVLRRAGPTLVVAPTSVCVNWTNEIARFAPELRVMEYLGKARRRQLEQFLLQGPGVVVTSYALLQQDAAQLAQVRWDTAVLDEAQFIKNATSLRAKAAYRLQADVRIAASGTPLENHLGDVWSIFHFLNPGLLGEWKDFRREFLRPIETDRDEAAQAELRRRLEPYILRRTKARVLAELPALTEVTHEVRFSETEKVRYAVLRKQVHDKLFTAAGRRDNKLEVLAEITRLRRFCCHPRLIFPDAEAESSKIDAFLELAEELAENQHRALVFSQFVDFLSLVREQLDERRIAYEYLDGSVPKAQRQRRVDAFQKGAAPLFLISLKAGGFGLNLTAADYVIHLDPWWNPAVEAQATDRAHRIGQKRAVTVYRLLMRHSIEESVTQLHTRKRELAAALLDGTERVATLDTSELLELLGGDSARA
jgi:hypothetical protein